MPSLSKRRRLNNQSPFEEDVYQSRAENDLWLKSRFESIFAKYERNFEDIGDEVELRSGRIVVNNGHLLSMHDEYDIGRKRQVGRHTADSFEHLQAPSKFARLLEKQTKCHDQQPTAESQRQPEILTPPGSFQRADDDDVDSLLGEVQDTEEQAVEVLQQTPSAYMGQPERGIWESGPVNQVGLFQFHVDPLWQAPPLPFKQKHSHPVTTPSTSLPKRSRRSSTDSSHPRVSLWADSPLSAPPKSHTLTRSSRRSTWTKVEARQLQSLMNTSGMSFGAIASKFPEKPKRSVRYRLDVMRQLTPQTMRAYILSCPDEAPLISGKAAQQENPEPVDIGQLDSCQERSRKELDSSNLPSLSMHGERNSARNRRGASTRSSALLIEKETLEVIKVPASTGSMVGVVLAKGPGISTTTGSKSNSESKALSAEKNQPLLGMKPADTMPPSLPHLSLCSPSQASPSINASELLLVSIEPTSLPANLSCPEVAIPAKEAPAILPEPSMSKTSSRQEDLQPQASVTPRQGTPFNNKSRASSAVTGKPSILELSGTPLAVGSKPAPGNTAKPSVVMMGQPNLSRAKKKAMNPSKSIAKPKNSRPVDVRSSGSPRTSSLVEDLSEDELSTPISTIARIRPKSISCKKRSGILYRAISDDEIDDLQL